MIFSIDRLQFVNGKLICYEFFDYQKEADNKDYIAKKIKIMESENFCDGFYLIQYKQINGLYNDIYIGKISEKNSKTWEDFKNWFNLMNKSNKQNINQSKGLGTATANIGDPYVQTFLKEIYRNDHEYSKIDFSLDDSGIAITQSALEKNNTYGFDFDLFESNSRVVIEFLKRDNNYVTNLTAHPSRYIKNHQKFASLWLASGRVGLDSPKLYLVNYSEDENEAISLIKIIDFNIECGRIESDTGYKLNNREELLEWLKLLNKDFNESENFLSKKPMEIRDHSFWKNVYISNDPKNWNKSKIGKNYI